VIKFLKKLFNKDDCDECVYNCCMTYSASYRHFKDEPTEPRKFLFDLKRNISGQVYRHIIPAHNKDGIKWLKELHEDLGIFLDKCKEKDSKSNEACLECW